MNIVFIYPDISGYSPLYKGMYYSGVAYLSAMLKQEKKFNIYFLHLTKPIGKDELLSKIKEFKPHLVAFSSTSNMFHYVKIWAKWIKNNYKDAKIICGGVHATIAPEDVIKEPSIDILCRGEGENSLVELCNKLNDSKDFSNIKGLWVKNNGRVYRNRLQNLIEDLNSLPFPDRSIFGYGNLHFEREGRFTVVVSRGCPYNCSYCCNGILREICSNGNKFVRFRSVDNTIRELRQIIDNYANVKSFSFDDDILPLDRIWFSDFSSRYKDEIGLPYSCNLRPNLVIEGVVDLLKYSGCNEIRMGIESGNDFIRNTILSRNISKDQLVKAFKLCKEAGLRIFSFNMLGLPHEDLPKMLETVKINAILKTDINLATIFYPYENTPLYNLCCSEGLINITKEVLDYSRFTMLKFNRLTKNRIIFIQRFFRILVKLYIKIDKLPENYSFFIKKSFERVVFSGLSSILFLPALIAVLDIIWKNRFLSLVVRKIDRSFLKGY